MFPRSLFPWSYVPGVHVFLCSCVPVFPCSCILVVLCSRVHVFLCSRVPVFLCSCVPVSLYSCVPVFMCSCVPMFLCSRISVSLCVYVSEPWATPEEHMNQAQDRNSTAQQHTDTCRAREQQRKPGQHRHSIERMQSTGATQDAGGSTPHP